MKISKAAEIWLEYYQDRIKESAVKGHQEMISDFCIEYGGREVTRLMPDTVMTYLSGMIDEQRPFTIWATFSSLHFFFRFIRANIAEDFTNPCDTNMLAQLFRQRKPVTGEYPKKATAARKSPGPQIPKHDAAGIRYLKLNRKRATSSASSPKHLCTLLG